MAQKTDNPKKKSSASSKTKTKDPVSSKSKPKAEAVADSPAQKKRKATEDVSPAATKKTRPDSKTASDKPQRKSRAAAPEIDTPATVKKAKSDTKKSPKKSQAKEPSPAVEDEAEAGAMVPFEGADGNGSEDEADEEIRALAAGLDSDDEETAKPSKSTYKDGQAVGKIPKIAKDAKKKAAGPASQGPKVIYISRLPHGFYERQMKEYFSQFGAITRIRLSRNKRTGASKHYAFVEFEDADVAEIVTKTMDNYLLFGRLLKVKLVPEERIHQELWKGANRRFKVIPWQRLDGERLAEPKEESAWKKQNNKTRRKQSARAAKLKSLGYEFEYPKLEDPVAVSAVAAPAESEEVEAAS